MLAQPAGVGAQVHRLKQAVNHGDHASAHGCVYAANSQAAAPIVRVTPVGEGGGTVVAFILIK